MKINCWVIKGIDRGLEHGKRHGDTIVSKAR